MNPIIIFNSTKDSQGIRFLCNIEVEKMKIAKLVDKNCSCGKKKTVSLNAFWEDAIYIYIYINYYIGY